VYRQTGDCSCGKETVSGCKITILFVVEFGPEVPRAHLEKLLFLLTKNNPRSGGNMVREFSYRGETFRATVHGRPGIEELFLIHMIDGEEGPEISLDRFEDPNNDPAQSLESKLADLADQLMQEHGLAPMDPDAGFAWAEPKTGVKVHSGVQHHAMEA
jgi:hypothetical protein